MKKFLLLAIAPILVLVSCKTSKLSSYADDVYTNPKEELRLARLAAEEKAKQLAAEEQQQQQALAAQKAKEAANPYYKDPNYKADDYYDYEYASRLNRFKNPVSGAGYYDPYYTNNYTYNQNPSTYGTSIYNPYNGMMPSSQFGTYSNGLSLGLSYGSGYNCGFGNNYYGNGYNPNYSNNVNNSYWNTGGYSSNYYNGGYGNSFGYNNGYYSTYGTNYYGNSWNTNNWGYYNSYDPNSTTNHAQVGPRDGDTGGDNSRTADAGRVVAEDNLRQRYLESVNAQQNATPRFTNIENNRAVRDNSSGNETSRVNQPRNDSQTNTNGLNTSGNYPNSQSSNTRSEQSTDRNSSTSGTRVTKAESDKALNGENNTNRSAGGSFWDNIGGGNSGGGGNSTPAPRSSGGGDNNGPR
jgi:hypothetical protein